MLARHYASGVAAPFDFAVIDEAQDISIAQIRFLAAIGTNRPNALFFAGDLGQRIFQQPFSWKVRGCRSSWPLKLVENQLSNIPSNPVSGRSISLIRKWRMLTAMLRNAREQFRSSMARNRTLSSVTNFRGRDQGSERLDDYANKSRGGAS